MKITKNNEKYVKSKLKHKKNRRDSLNVYNFY